MTKIEWVGRSWNPVTGCTPVSEGCKNCYAERMAKRMAGRFGYPKKKPFQVTTHTDRLDQPQNWRKPSSIFVCSMGDLFHESLPFWAIDAVIGSCMAANWHTYIFLTKRPVIAYNYFDSTSDRMENFQKLKGILGVTAENQAWADKRIPILLQIPAAKRFVSCEPLLSPVDLNFNIKTGYGSFKESYLNIGLDWVICGGETGPGARPMHPDWAKSLRDQCQEASVPFFFKSWGEWKGNYPGDSWEPSGRMQHYYFDGPDLGKVWRCGKKNAGRLIDGQTWAQYPGVE